MKKQFFLLVAGVLGLCLLPFRSPAQITLGVPPRSRIKGAEVISLRRFIDEAAKLLARGDEEALLEFRQPGSRWNNGGADIFVIDATPGAPGEGRFLVYPASRFVGEESLDLETVNALAYLQEAREKLKEGKNGGIFFFIPPETGRPAYANKLVQTPSGRIYLLLASVNSLSEQKYFVESLVSRAAALIRKEGKKAFPTLRRRDSIFRFKDTYVFVLTDNGIPVVDPATPEYVGQDMIKTHPELADIYRKILKAAASKKGYGWVNYNWVEPGGGQPKRKAAFVKKATSPDGTFVVGSGVYLKK